MEALRLVVKKENEDSSLYLHKFKKHGKEYERMGGFVHYGKMKRNQNKIGFGTRTKRKKTLKKTLKMRKP